MKLDLQRMTSMNNRSFVRLILTLALGLLSMLVTTPVFAVSPAQVAALPGGHYVPGQVVVKFSPLASEREIRTQTANLNLRHIDFSMSGAPSRIFLPSGMTVAQGLAALQKMPGVIYAEPNYLRRRLATALAPNDPHYSEQWPMENTVSSVISALDADMDMSEAWGYLDSVNGGKGGDASGVTVAIIDDGFKLDHEDLQGNFIQGVDCSTVTNGTCGGGSPASTSTNQDHGTLVAGCVGAVGNNGIGIAGAAWTVKMLPIKTDLSSTSLVASIRYAVDHGADVINISLGGPDFSQAEYDAIAYARENDVLVVAAAGNEDSDMDKSVASYPANYDLPNVLAVAASNREDDIAFFSTWGPFHVNLAAPGYDIYTTDLAGGYATVSGTSFSSPYTAGVAALVAQRLIDQGTTQSPGAPRLYREIKAHLMAGAEMTGSSGSGTIYGRVQAGRLNGSKAVQDLTAGVFVVKGVTVNDDPSIDPANDGDGELDPGETVDITVTLQNDGPDEPTDVTGMLSVIPGALKGDFATVTTTTPQSFGPMMSGKDPNNTNLTQNATATATYRVHINSFSDEEQALFKLALTPASAPGQTQTRYFYMEIAHLDNAVAHTQAIERTDWDEFHQYHIDVPVGATNLAIETHTSNNVDIDLLARYSKPPEYQIELSANPEAPGSNPVFYTDPETKVSGNANGDELIQVANPQAGTWYAVVVNFAQQRIDYTVKASYDAPGAGSIRFTTDAITASATASNVSLDLTRSGGVGAVNIDYATADGTAAAGTDYTVTSGTVSWADGDTSTQTITIPLLHPAGQTSTRSFTVNLSNPTGGAVLGRFPQVTVNISAPATTPTPPPTTSGSSGGGGLMGLGWLSLLGLMAVLRRRG